MTMTKATPTTEPTAPAPRQRAPRQPHGDPADRAVEALIERFTSDLLTVPNASTISDYRQSVQQFLNWVADHGDRFGAATVPTKSQVVAYHEYLIDKGYSPHTIRKHLAAVRHFTAYLIREDLKRPGPESAVESPAIVEPATVPAEVVTPARPVRAIESAARHLPSPELVSRAELEVEALRAKLEKREQYAQQLENLLRVQAVPPIPYRDLKRQDLRPQELKQILAQVEMIALQEGIATVSTQKLLSVPGLSHEWLQTIAFIGNAARGMLKPWDETTYFEFLYALRLCRFLQQRGIPLQDVVLYHERRSRAATEGVA